ncbi:hypothetical protein GCM10011452_16970 [Gemmobacter lanyuensis]|uniref:Uncharacterized protein n=1 Tax=Gemmobacter lanyuensis TaxID=1054497 RepID=A0A918IRH3_9RHOB|nr:DUF1176 domain-containing protein [Gemmobacter lanyuensis]GGW29055.1 hypothetical protein GCM10011452_16970 [Gemmobacter lanyuensis]
MMMNRKVLIGMAALLLSTASAQAQDLATFDSVEGWDILIDPTIGNGCLINAQFEDGSDVRIGFDMAANTGYVWASNAAWGDIEEGKSYPLSFSLDGEVYEGEGKGLYIDDAPGVDIEFDSVDFLMALAQKQTMELSNSSGPVMTIDLSGSAAALSRAVECQDQQG